MKPLKSTSLNNKIAIVWNGINTVITMEVFDKIVCIFVPLDSPLEQIRNEICKMHSRR
jgi:hypothetical protein